MTRPADAVQAEQEALTSQDPSGNKESTNPDTQAETEVDWEARAKELTEANAKLANENKTLAGRTRADRLDEIAEMIRDGQDETVALRRSVNAVGVRTASGETDELADDLLKIDQSTATQQAGRQYERGYAKAESDLFNALREEDDDGNPVTGGKIVVDTDSPEVVALTTKWTSAKTARDLTALRDLVTDAHKLRRRMDRLAASKAADDTEEAQKGKDAKNGIHNLSLTNPATGGEKKMSRAQIEKSTDVDAVRKNYRDYVDNS
jgi:hypothetical protein